MKVVFLQDVVRVARAGEIKDVANGYGRNYLIPRKLAVPADAKSMKAAESQIKANARFASEAESGLLELAGQLAGKEITIKAKSGVNDRLYGSITAADVAAEIESALGLTVDRKKIDIDQPIRQLGNYNIAIRLTYDINPIVALTVASDAPAPTAIVEEVPFLEETPDAEEAAASSDAADAEEAEDVEKAEEAEATEEPEVADAEAPVEEPEATEETPASEEPEATEESPTAEES